MSSDPHAYLKWPRLIAFNLNGALAITATGLAARSLVNLNSDKATLAASIPGAKLAVTDVIAVTAIMTTATGLASLYTAALSTIITLKIQRRETSKTILIKEILMGFMALFILGSAIAAAAIIVPRSAGVSAPGLSEPLLVRLIQASGKSLAYRDSLAYPTMIVVWICFGTTLISFVLAAMAARHIRKYGPEDTLVGHYESHHHGDRHISATNGHSGLHEKQHNKHVDNHHEGHSERLSHNDVRS